MALGGQDTIEPTDGVSILTGAKELYRQRWEEDSKQNSFWGGVYQCKKAYSEQSIVCWVTSILVDYYACVGQCSSKCFTRSIFSALSSGLYHTHPTCIDTHTHTHISDSGTRVNPTTTRKKNVLSLLMTKTNGPGMIFLVTLRRVAFVRHLEQHSTRSLGRGPCYEDRKEEPIRLGKNVHASWEQRKHSQS